MISWRLWRDDTSKKKERDDNENKDNSWENMEGGNKRKEVI